MTTGPTGRPDATPGATVAANAPGVARLTDTVYCDGCGDHIPVVLQVPLTTSVKQVAEDLAAVTFEATVLHDLAAHLDGLVGA